MEDANLGTFAIDDRPSQSSLGYYFVPGRGYFAHIWRESYGPFATIDEAIARLRELTCPHPGMLDGWKNAARRLLAPVVVAITLWLMAWLLLK